MVFCHAVCQDIIGRIVITKHFCFLYAQFHLTHDDRFIIIIVIMISAGSICHEQFFAQLTVLTVLQYWGE